MKKSIICIGIVLGCLNVRASVVTNYVYVISNIFNNVYTENVVTQKVKNTHYNYYFTNYVSVVTNVYQTTFCTNIDVNVIFDNFGPWVNAASNSAANASSYANSAAASATAAGSSASRASTAASEGLAHINERIDWFDEHLGGMVTNINITITTNVYYAEDSVARLGVTRNAAAITANALDITNLNERVDGVAATAGANALDITNLNERVNGVAATAGTNALDVTNLNERVDGIAATATANALDVTNLNARVDGVGTAIAEIAAQTNRYYEIVKETYLPGGDWKYEVVNALGEVVSTFTIHVNQGIVSIGGTQNKAYSSVGVSGSGLKAYGNVIYPSGAFEIKLCESFSSAQYEYVTFDQHITDVTMPPFGRTSATSTLNPGTYARYKSSPKSRDVILSKFDPTEYDEGTNAVGRVVFTTDLVAFSNWVETVFQKR